ncbi:MAG: dimethylsulfonioproprionate lyase family protein [Pseudomonadota bacterium]
MTRLATAAACYAEARRLLTGADAAQVAEGLPEALCGADQPGRRVPVARFLPDLPALAAARTRPLVEAFCAAPDLTWNQSYTAEDFGAAFLDNYGWVEFLGPYGPAPSDTHRLAIVLFGPGTHYPAHAHGPEEVYIPLAGAIDWHLGDTTRRMGPGELLHHAPWQPHGFTTGATPAALLALWRGGDLAAKSTILEEAQP